MRAVVIASLALTGCFYIDPINQRPSLDINQDVVGPIYRGEQVAFSAIVVDPDDHGVDLRWRAYLCTDATTSTSCDADAAESGVGPTFAFVVPRTRADGSPVQGMRIVLDGVDDHGASAKPTDQLELAVLDRNPDIAELRRTSVYEQPGPTYVVGMPVEIYARYGDGDDPLDTLAVDWKVFAPQQVPIDLVDRPLGEPDQVGKVLRPQVTGQWSVEVTVTDPVGNAAKSSVPITVVDDRPPCIDAVSPIVPGPAEALPVTEPTLFQVPIVSDDLDSYPKTAGGAEFGEPTWVWSIKTPGNPRQVISGATGSSTLFDPATYTPGTIVELRVEIADRKQTALTCADTEPTCSIGATSCIQRQTWRVEAR